MTTPTTTATTSTTIEAAVLDTPIGLLTITGGDGGIRSIDFGDTATGDAAGGGSPIVAEACRQLGEYFAGERRDFDLPLDAVGSDFQRRAWNALREIPFGTTISYGEQAATLGDRRKARAVGAANGANPIPIVVPCHRVVGSDGSLTGFAGGVDAKRWLLDHEAEVAGTRLL